MEIDFNVRGTERKQLVEAIAQYTGKKQKYLGAPDFSFQVGRFSVSVDGKVTIEDNSTAAPLIRFLREKGFQAEDPLTYVDSEIYAEEQTFIDEPYVVCISMPRTLFTDNSLENLKAIVGAKSNLIKKALCVDNLPIEETDTKISFPWFPRIHTPEELKAYETFICKLCEMAQNAKRVVAKEKETDNEKYAFRCFLLRLGFIGAEFKTERRILLRNLTGSSAFRNGQSKEEGACQ